MDDKGNILIKRVGRCSVYVKSLTNSPDGLGSCLGKDIIESKGKLEYKKVSTLFDIRSFQASITAELKTTYPQARKLESQCITAITFGKESGNIDLMESPSWIMIINIVALELLRSELPTVNLVNSINQSLVSLVKNGGRSHHNHNHLKQSTNSPKGREVITNDRKGNNNNNNNNINGDGGSIIEGNSVYQLIAYEAGLIGKNGKGQSILTNGKPSTGKSELKISKSSVNSNKGDKLNRNPLNRNQLKSIGCKLRLPDPDYDYELPPIRESTLLRKGN